MIWTAVGVLMLVVLLWEIFVTVFDPHAHSGSLTTWYIRLFWRVWAPISRAGRPGRLRMLSLGGPVLAVTTLFLWGAVFLTGFALIYMQHMEGFVFQAGVPGAPWLEALYFSGYVLTTLGLGDVVPDEGWLRLTTVAEAMSGAILLSSVVTYILSVYGVVRESSTFAAAVRSSLGPDDAEDRDEDVPQRIASAPEQWDAWALRTAGDLTAVVQALSQYPILHYFRPPDPEDGLVTQVGHLIDLLDRVEEEDLTLFHTYPGWRTLRNAMERYLEEVDREFVRGTPDEDMEHRSEARKVRHGRVMKHLYYRTDDL